MAKKRRKFSKEHLANLRAAHAKRRGKKIARKQIIITSAEKITNWKPTTTFEFQLNKSPIEIPVLGLAERFKLAVDAIEEQVKRLETILVST